MGFYDREYLRGEGGHGGVVLRAPQSAITWIVILNVGVWLVDAFTPARDAFGHVRVLSRWLSLQSDVWQRPWLLWQLVTYGFVHSPLGSPNGIWHIGMNMFVLWMFGRVLEWEKGRWEFLRFYLAAVLVAGLGWLVVVNLATPQPAFLLGASGGVSAVFILFVLKYPRQTVYLFGLIAIPAWVAGLLLVGLDALRAFSEEFSGRVAWQAHLTGAAFAFLYHQFGWNLGRWLPSGPSWRLAMGWKKPRLRVHDPDEWFQKLEAEADRILEKLRREGVDSLTSSERKTLEKYSRAVRERRH